MAIQHNDQFPLKITLETQSQKVARLFAKFQIEKITFELFGVGFFFFERMQMFSEKGVSQQITIDDKTLNCISYAGQNVLIP